MKEFYELQFSSLICVWSFGHWSFSQVSLFTQAELFLYFIAVCLPRHLWFPFRLFGFFFLFFFCFCYYHKVTLSQFFSIVQYQVSNYIPCKTLKKHVYILVTNKMVQFFIHNPIYSYVSCRIEKCAWKSLFYKNNKLIFFPPWRY